MVVVVVLTEEVVGAMRVVCTCSDSGSGCDSGSISSTSNITYQSPETPSSRKLTWRKKRNNNYKQEQQDMGLNDKCYVVFKEPFRVGEMEYY